MAKKSENKAATTQPVATTNTAQPVASVLFPKTYTANETKQGKVYTFQFDSRGFCFINGTQTNLAFGGLNGGRAYLHFETAGENVRVEYSRKNADFDEFCEKALAHNNALGKVARTRKTGTAVKTQKTAQEYALEIAESFIRIAEFEMGVRDFINVLNNANAKTHEAMLADKNASEKTEEELKAELKKAERDFVIDSITELRTKAEEAREKANAESEEEAKADKILAKVEDSATEKKLLAKLALKYGVKLPEEEAEEEEAEIVKA